MPGAFTATAVVSLKAVRLSLAPSFMVILGLEVCRDGKVLLAWEMRGVEVHIFLIV
jgi:hypothetical protein